MNKAEIPDWVIYPQDKWVQITPAQAGFDAVKFNSIVGDSQAKGGRWEGEVHEEEEWGAVLTRGGYLVWVWGNPAYKYQTASVGKAFSRALVGLAVEAGLIQPDDL